MQDTLFVSQVETLDKVKSNLSELFQKGRYEEVARCIGMYSILIDPQHTIADQSQLFHSVLDMIKAKMRKSLGQDYAAWLTAFPARIRAIATTNMIVTDKAAAVTIASHMDAYGTFRSADDFYFWALDDRRLPLDQIVAYIEKTAQTPSR